MSDPDLAAIQRTILGELHDALAGVLAAAPGTTAAEASTGAHLLVAAADGLALHAVTAGGWLSPAEQRRALKRLVTTLVP
jgi:hypothetical protein